MAGGARAAVLVGSHARGDAGPDSDVDLLAVGEGQPSWLERRGGLLVSVNTRSSEAYRDSFASPELVCGSVPAWRGAVVLRDPEGLAAALVKEAKVWTWRKVEERCDKWVAEQITGYAEESHKLVAAYNSRRLSTAAVQRALLAVHLAPVLAVHLRILYSSENWLWDLIADAMGKEWREAQSAALGLDDEDFKETCAAALRLYRLAADTTFRLLDGRQRRVVRRAQSASL
ncbi:MAG: nucleotidyltransferase family protein [Rubrobacter sp.]